MSVLETVAIISLALTALMIGFSIGKSAKKKIIASVLEKLGDYFYKSILKG